MGTAVCAAIGAADTFRYLLLRQISTHYWSVAIDYLPLLRMGRGFLDSIIGRLVVQLHCTRRAYMHALWRMFFNKNDQKDRHGT